MATTATSSRGVHVRDEEGREGGSEGGREERRVGGDLCFCGAEDRHIACGIVRSGRRIGRDEKDRQHHLWLSFVCRGC